MSTFGCVSALNYLAHALSAPRFDAFAAEPPAVGWLQLCLALFDPVLGNLLLSVRCDALGRTVANQARDLSRCRVLARVLAIYPHEPLPDLAFHAPLLPRYPLAAAVEEDATLGCHQGALFVPGEFNQGRAANLACHCPRPPGAVKRP